MRERLEDKRTTNLIFEAGPLQKIFAAGMPVFFAILGYVVYEDWVSTVAILAVMLVILGAVFLRRTVFCGTSFTSRDAIGRTITGRYDDIEAAQYRPGGYVKLVLKDGRRIQINAVEGDTYALLDFLRSTLPHLQVTPRTGLLGFRR